MSSIASPTRIEAADRLSATLHDRRVAIALASALLTVLLVTFRPFVPDGPAQKGGDVVNQIGFSSIGLLALAGIFMLAEPRRALALLSPAWLLLLALLAVAVGNALDPPSAARAAIFTFTGILAIGAIVALPRDGDAFATVFGIAGFVVVLLCYSGLVLFPGEAIHGGGGVEPQHIGLWRGSFSHKNIAGPVMACLSFVGIYLWRHGWRKRGAILCIAAMVFMANTGSKTTLGLVPVTMLLVLLPRILGAASVMPVIFWAAALGNAAATVGLLFLHPLRTWLVDLGVDVTYTGRATLWEYSLSMIEKRPWTGYGYESFWLSPLVRSVEKSFDSEWSIGGAVHGHNGYLDIAVTMGLPALAVAIAAFWAAPVRDYVRAPRWKENVYLADLFMMILLFTSLNAFLESFFLRRADPVWLFFVLAAFGLRMIARFPVPAAAEKR